MKRLIDIQNELKAPKNQYNSFGKYKYRSCEDILEGVKPLLKDKGLALVIQDDLELIGDRYYIRAIATIYDDEGKKVAETSAYAREEENKKGMDSSQVTGATSSYARKYALNGLFAIDDTKDADATNTHGKEPEKPTTKQSLTEDDKDMIQVISKCETMDELKESWMEYYKLASSDFAKKELQKAKDKRKKEIGS